MLIKKIIFIFKKKGFLELLKKISEYIYYNLKSKKEFTFFYIDFKNIPDWLNKSDTDLTIKIAEEKDIQKILADLTPFLTHTESNDVAFIKKIGMNNFKCFIVELGGSVVHYSLLFENALESPLIKTVLDKNLISIDDAYLGTVFTIPSARGLWIVPEVLSFIILHLKNRENIRRLYAIVHKDTSGAVAYYERLRFKKI